MRLTIYNLRHESVEVYFLDCYGFFVERLPSLDGGESYIGSHASTPFALHEPSKDEQLIGSLEKN